MLFIQTIETKTKGKVRKVHYTDPKTGQRRTKSYKTRKEALAFMQSVSEVKPQSSKNLTFSDAAENWIETCRDHGRKGREPVARSTLRQYKGHVSIFLAAKVKHGNVAIDLASSKLNKIDKAFCKSIRLYLTQNYSWAYARKLLTSFKSILAQARSDELMFHTPDEEMFIRRPKKAKERIYEASEKVMQLEEARHLCLTVRDRIYCSELRLLIRRLRYRLIIETMAFGGTRPGEALGLPWAGVNQERCGIEIFQDADEGEIGELKTESSYRFIPMPQSYMRRLCYWHELCPAADSDLVFPNEAGNVEYLSNFNARGWQPSLKDAGLLTEEGKAKYPPKSLRHFRASIEISEGANPKDIMKLMGHSSITMTFDIYGHQFDAHNDARQSRAEHVESHLLA